MTTFPADNSPLPARPLLLDTDIGTDIDDAYALMLAAVSPEFDLRAVTTVNNDTTLRARIARRLLDLLGRQDVPVAVGARDGMTPDETRGWMGHEGQGVHLDDTPAPDQVPPDYVGYAREDAAQTIAETALRCADEGVPLTVCPIGAMTNLALALRRYPEQAGKIGQVIAMASDFGGYGPENARTEHNIACDPVAARVVLQSGLPLMLIGLNVTRHTPMNAQDVAALGAIGGPLAQDLTGMHRIWFDKIHADHSPMHDGLTLAQQIDPAILTFAPAFCSVVTEGEERGRVIYQQGSPLDASSEEEALMGLPIQAALHVDAPRYHRLLQGRVQEAVRRAKDRAARS